MHKYQPRFQLVRCSDPSMIQYPSLLNSNLVKYVNHLINSTRAHYQNHPLFLRTLKQSRKLTFIFVGPSFFRKWSLSLSPHTKTTGLRDSKSTTIRSRKASAILARPEETRNDQQLLLQVNWIDRRGRCQKLTQEIFLRHRKYQSSIHQVNR